MAKGRPRLRSLPSRLPSAPYRLPVQGPDEAERSRLRDIEAPWRAWYRTARWRTLRDGVFRRDLYQCQMCGRAIADPKQRVCDHKRPHRGDEALFWPESNLQTLCKACHDGPKQAMDRRRF